MKWEYIACDCKHLPKEVSKSNRDLSNDEIRYILENIPLVEGEIDAINIESVISLLLFKNLFPIKLHIKTIRENKINLIKKLIKKIT